MNINTVLLNQTSRGVTFFKCLESTYHKNKNDLIENTCICNTKKIEKKTFFEKLFESVILKKATEQRFEKRVGGWESKTNQKNLFSQNKTCGFKTIFKKKS